MEIYCRMLENNINLRKKYLLRNFSSRCFSIAEVQAWEDNNTHRLSDFQRRDGKWKVR